MVNEPKSVKPLSLFSERFGEDISYLLQGVHIDHVKVFSLELLLQPSETYVLGAVSMAHFLTVTLVDDRDSGLIVFKELDTKNLSLKPTCKP